MFPARLLLVTILGLPAAAAAQEDEEAADTSFAVLLGTDTAFDGDPATLRFTALGTKNLLSGSLLGLDVAVPATWMTTGDDRIGISGRNSVVEIPPSLRLELLPRMFVRPYADLGVGLVVATRNDDGRLYGESSRRVGWMTRSALGVELGPPGGVVFIVEPLTARTYGLEGNYARLGGMVGLGTHF